MRETVSSLIGTKTVIPVVVIDDPDHAIPLAENLLASGYPMIEVTLRTSSAFESVCRITSTVKDCIVGVGSILSQEQLVEAKNSGAHFGVSPGTSPSLRNALTDEAWPFLPGAATVSEVMTLRELGFYEQKLFPAQILGGVDFLKSISGPVADVKFCPTGGIRATNVSDFLSLSNVLAVGGTWIASRDLVKDQEWSKIPKNNYGAETG